MRLKHHQDFDNCLKNRQFFYLIKYLWCLVFILGCGVKTNAKIDQVKLESLNSFFLIESNCNANQYNKSPIFFEIQSFYSRALSGDIKVIGNWLVESRFYFLHPMVVNEEILKAKLDLLEKDFLKGQIILVDLLDLMEMANRFEGQKCNFRELIDKKETDLSSYLNLTHQCAKKFQNECNEDSLQLILDEKNESDILSLCSSSKRLSQCKQEYDFSRRSKTLGKMTDYYFKKVEREKFQSLFLLRANHRRFTCEKFEEEVFLKLRVYNDGFQEELFQDIINNIEKVWSKNKLKLQISSVSTGMEYDLKVTAIQNELSHVKNNDLTTMYLDKELDRMTIVSVAAHEFGHNLGFPDCYIEYFDTAKNALVYYELSPKNRNIMCSLKAGYKVEDEYIDQIVEKTCKFQAN